MNTRRSRFRTWTKRLCLTLALLMLSQLNLGWSRSIVPIKPTKQITNSQNLFALDFYHALRKNEKGNLFFSPNSIYTALMMVYAGSKGGTADEMRKALHIKLSRAALHKGFADFIAALEKSLTKKGVTLNIANAMWVKKDLKLSKAFVKLIKESYKGRVDSLDFLNASQEAAKIINSWIAKQTNNKIKNVVTARWLKRATAAILVNAIYFKGDWLNKFAKTATKELPFYLANGKSVRVPLMYQQHLFRYAENSDVKLVELPYKGKTVSMIVLLPKRGKTLSEIEARLNHATLSGWLRGLGHAQVKLHLPRFTFRHDIGLVKLLKSLGIKSAFKEFAADFRRIRKQRDIFIAGALHQAFIEVNEKGTEATAITIIKGGLRTTSVRMPPRVVEFRADRPFIYMIRDNATGAILFMGRMSNPS